MMYRFNLFLCVITLFLLMCCTYIYYMIPLFEYSGFQLLIGNMEIVLSVIALFFCTCFIGKDFKSNYYFLILCISIIPSTVLFAVGGASEEFFFITIYAYIMVVFSSKLKIMYVKFFSFNMDFLIKFFAISSGLFIASIILQGGYKYINFDILSVYDFRGKAADNLIGIYSYFSPIFGKIVLPILISISLFTKRYIYLILGITFSICLFALTAHKSPLLYPIIIICVYFVINSKYNFNYILVCTFSVLTVYSAIDFYFMIETEQGFFGSLFFRRAIILPAYLNSLYIDFFSNNEFYYWANSKFSFGLVDTTYQYNAAYLIGSIYFNNPESGANTGLIGSGYANLGILGVTIYSILTGILISYFYAASKYIGTTHVFAYSFILFLTVILSTDLTTALLTHGLLGLLLILSIHPLENTSENS